MVLNSLSHEALEVGITANNALLFVKIATPRRRHVTEMKCISQIRYMAIDKRLELQNCTVGKKKKKYPLPTINVPLECFRYYSETGNVTCCTNTV